MIGYLIGIIAVLVAGAGYIAYERHEAVASYKASIELREAQLQQLAAQLELEANNHITDMEAAYESGEANAKVITRTIVARGEADVAKYAVFSNPACVLPDSSLLVLNSARAGLLPAADTSPPDGKLPAAAEDPRRKDSDPVPTDAEGRGSVSPVSAEGRPTDSSGAVPRPSVREHPKPKPITK